MATNYKRSWPDNRHRFIGGGKSGLHWAGCQVTPGRREPMESATENIPPRLRGKGEMVRQERTARLVTVVAG